MKGNEKVIAALNEALQEELTADVGVKHLSHLWFAAKTDHGIQTENSG